MAEAAPNVGWRNVKPLSGMDQSNRFFDFLAVKGYEFNALTEGGKTKVDLRIKEFSAPITNSERATIYFAGFGYNGDSDSIRGLCESLADHYKQPDGRYSQATYAVSAQPKKGAKDIQDAVSEAMIRFLQAKGVKEVTLVGQSLGGPQVIRLARRIEEQASGIEVHGLALLSSVALYDRTTPQTLKDYAVEMAAITFPNEARMHPAEKINARLISQEGARFVLREMLAGRVKPMDIIRLVSTKSKDLTSIHTPVVLIEGARDRLSNAEKILPRSVSPEERKKVLQGLFPNSKGVYLFVGEKRGSHGIMVSRPETVANVALGTLDKSWKIAQPAS